MQRLIDCIPIIVGALIAIVPSTIEKAYSNYTKRKNDLHEKKEKLYIELISILSKYVSTENIMEKKEYEKKLGDYINIINITGDVKVVYALNDYVESWGKSGTKEEQAAKYTTFIKLVRKELGVTKRLEKDFPNLGLRHISSLEEMNNCEVKQ